MTKTKKHRRQKATSIFHSYLMKPIRQERTDDPQNKKLTEIEKAILTSIQGLAQYADQYYAECEQAIGEDGVIGNSWEDALRGVHGLLTGPSGFLECATVDSLIRKLLTNEGFDSDIPHKRIAL